MGLYDSEVAQEQAVVDRIYAVLDQTRQDYRRQQRQVESQKAAGSPGARTDRDTFAAHFGDEAARLEQVEDRLVFGRLDQVDSPQALYIGRVGLRSKTNSASSSTPPKSEGQNLSSCECKTDQGNQISNQDQYTQRHPGPLDCTNYADQCDEDDANTKQPHKNIDSVQILPTAASSPSPQVNPNPGDEQLLIDWRARAAVAFYQATALKPMGVVRRRHLALKRRQVTGLEDEVLDAQAALNRGTSFQGEGALMAALSTGRGAHMQDIVSTIQAEQDRIIRHDCQGLLVVQGGPGTGKTAVALHRAAYLLYSQRLRLARAGVLVVGPSDSFLRYIEQVLPALGETGVVCATIGTLYPGINTKRHDNATLARLKGDLRWVKIVKEVIRRRQRLPRADQSFQIGNTTVNLRRSDVKTARQLARASGLTFNEAWSVFASHLLQCLVEQAGGTGTDPDTIAWIRSDIRANAQIRRAINLCWLPISAPALVERLFSRPDLLSPFFSPTECQLLYRPPQSGWSIEDVPIIDEFAEALGPVIAQKLSHQYCDQDSPRTTSKGNKNNYYESPLRTTIGQESRDLEREYALAQSAIESQNLGGGLVNAQMLVHRVGSEESSLSLSQRASRERTWTYGHVVVDEAQELSALAWQMLLRRCPSRSFTVVGDLAQCSHRGNAQTWRELLGPATRAWSGEESLSVCYRTPAKILDLANAVSTKAGNPPPVPMRAARDLPDCLSIQPLSDLKQLPNLVSQQIQDMRQAYGDEPASLAIIVPEKILSICQEMLNLEAKMGTQRRCVISATAAKGLEFDQACVLEPAAILAESPANLYVALTRPTKRLVVAHIQDLPAGF